MIGAAWSTAVPCTRRMPAETALTRAEPVGLGWPAARCAWLIDDSRRAMVLALGHLGQLDEVQRHRLGRRR